MTPWPYIEGADERSEKFCKANVPSPEGLALGVELSRITQNQRPAWEAAFPKHAPPCSECAFVSGTMANGCAVTLMNAVKCAMEGEVFFCHKQKSQEDKSDVPCVGFLMFTNQVDE